MGEMRGGGRKQPRNGHEARQMTAYLMEVWGLAGLCWADLGRF